MNKLHHNTKKRAEKLGIQVFVNDKGQWIARSKGGKYSEGSSGTDALHKLEAILNAMTPEEETTETESTEETQAVNAYQGENAGDDEEEFVDETDSTEEKKESLLQSFFSIGKSKTTSPVKETEVKESGKSLIGKSYKTTYALKGDGVSTGDAISIALKKDANSFLTEGEKPTADSRANARKSLYRIAHKNGIDTDRYEKLNNGMVRMAIGNRLRGLVRSKSVVVFINNNKIKSL